MRTPDEDLAVVAAEVNAQEARMELDGSWGAEELRTKRINDMVLGLPSQTTRRERLRREREADAALMADLDRWVEEQEQPEDPEEARVRYMASQLKARWGRWGLSLLADPIGWQ